MSSLVPTTGFVQGASGAANPYDTSPAGLGLSPAYLSSASASASSSNTSSGTIFPTSPADGDIFVYLADATSGIKWTFQYRSSSSSSYKWEFMGGAALYSAVATAESTSSAALVALATAGPSIVLPFAGDYDITIGAEVNVAAEPLGVSMSYAIGGTAAAAADACDWVLGGTVGGLWSERTQRKTGLTAVTLAAKYASDGATSGTWRNRTMSVRPSRVSG